jgi:hypothetical protein
MFMNMYLSHELLHGGECVGRQVAQLRPMTLLNRLLKALYNAPSAFGDLHLDHPPIEATSFSHEIFKPLEAVEEPGHIGHLGDQLKGDIPAGKPVGANSLKDL